MIPKVFHYCWLSNEPFPEKVLRCMESWEKYLGDYNCIFWDYKKAKETGIPWILEAMEQGMVCIFSAGTGSPYFTTDTGSSLRGIEIEADVMLKGTRVDGVYTADPEKDPTATKFSDITFDEVYNRNLKVMDLTATTMCKENDLPIYVFNMDVPGNLRRVIDGEPIGTLVHK